jgi:glucose/arabinose dehydrogenase
MKTLKKLSFYIMVFSSGLFPFSSRSQVNINQFATGFSGITDIKNAGDDRLFIVEVAGLIKIVDRLGNVNPVPFLNIQFEVTSGGEQGLLGLAFSPNYRNDGCFYVNYTGAGGHTHIARFHVSATNPDSADVSSEELLIFVTQPFVNHNGGCLQFGNDGYLYCALGDGGNGGDPFGNGQNVKDTLGNLLRIDVSPVNGYTIPSDNPFINDTNANPLIWAYGLRNPWRFSFDRMTHDLWIGDVGQSLWEEIDFQSAQESGGKNYGWRCYEGNHPYNTTGCGVQTDYVSPVYEYAHSTINGCSVTGGYVYRGGKYAAMFGKYFFIDYCSGLLQSLKRDTGLSWIHNQEGDFTDYNFGTFGEDRYGELYLGGFTNGTLYKIVNADCTPVAYIYDKDTMYVCGDSVVLETPLADSLQYEWFYNGGSVIGADSNKFIAGENGSYSVTVTTMNNLCSNASKAVYVFFSSSEDINFSGLPASICKNFYSPELIGNPSGGYFTGEGVSDNFFNPDSVSSGTHTITYNYLTSYGCVIRKEQTITVSDCIDSTVIVAPIIIAPNPVTHNLTVDFSFDEEESSEIVIYDASGKICMKENILIIRGASQRTFNFKSIASGIYLFQLKNSKTLFQQKFVIAKSK